MSFREGYVGRAGRVRKTGRAPRWAKAELGRCGSGRWTRRRVERRQRRPIETDLEVTGHPVVHLWFVTDASDLDFFVYLEAVDGNKSTYLTEGNLRASHRVLSKAPFNNLDLPYHRHYRSDLAPIQAG